MENSHPNPHDFYRRLVVVGSFIVTGLAVILLKRRGKPPLVSQPVPEQESLFPPLKVTQKTPARNPALRRLAFGLIVMVSVGVLIILQNSAPQLAGPFFVALVAGSIVVGVGTDPQIPREMKRPILAGWHWLSARIHQLWTGISSWAVANREALAPVLAWGGIALLVASAVWFEHARLGSPLLDAAGRMMLVGMLLVIVSSRLHRDIFTLPVVIPVSRPTRYSLVHRASLLLGVLCLAALAESNANLFHIPALYDVNTDGQFVLLCAGITFIVLGLADEGVGLRGRFYRWLHPSPFKVAARVSDDDRKLLIRSAYRLSLIGILFLAFALRFWHLHDANRIFTDELNHVYAIQDVLRDPHIALLSPFSGVVAFPYIFPYFQKLAVDIFGHNYIGLRAASAVIGTLTVAAAYLLARALFDRKTALIAALLLATFPPHVHFSRLGLNNIADPFFGTLALAFLARGWRANRRVDWALGGAMLGLTHYFYEAGRLIFLPLVVVWLIALWWFSRAGKSADKPATRRHVLTAVLAFILVALPVYYTLVGMDRPLAARLVQNQMGLSSDYWRGLAHPTGLQLHLAYHVVPALSVYMTFPDRTLFYAGNTPLLLPYVAPFFLLGLACLVSRWRSPGALLLLLWLLGVTAGNSMLVSSTDFTRYVLVTPALMLIAAVGIRYGLPLIFRVGSRFRWQTALIAAVALLLAFLQSHYYFTDHMAVLNIQTRNGWAHPDAEDAILRSLSFPAGTGIHIVSAPPADEGYNISILHFMRPDLDLDTLSPLDLTPEYFSKLDCGVDHAFFLVPNDADSLWRVRQAFFLRQPALSPYDDISIDRQYALYYAPYWSGSDQPFHRYRCAP